MRTTANFDKYKERIKKCQSRETFEECSQMKLLNYLKNQCECIPCNLMNLEKFKKVSKNIADYNRKNILQ